MKTDFSAWVLLLPPFFKCVHQTAESTRSSISLVYLWLFHSADNSNKNVRSRPPCCRGRGLQRSRNTLGMMFIRSKLDLAALLSLLRVLMKSGDAAFNRSFLLSNYRAAAKTAPLNKLRLLLFTTQSFWWSTSRPFPSRECFTSYTVWSLRVQLDPKCAWETRSSTFVLFSVPWKALLWETGGPAERVCVDTAISVCDGWRVCFYLNWRVWSAASFTCPPIGEQFCFCRVFAVNEAGQR